MTQSLFNQSFLHDSLNLSQDVLPQQKSLASGIVLKLHQRGVLEVIPANLDENTKHIVASCGVHGDETAPMELVDKIVADIESGLLNIEHRCLFIIAHPEATNIHKRFVEENLNRLFDIKEHPLSKDTSITKERVIAETLKSLVKQFYQNTDSSRRWHLDLHCAIRLSKHYSFAVSPKSRHPVRSRELVEFIEKGHVEAILLSNAPSGTFSWYSAENFAAQAVTLELGRVAKIGHNQLEKLAAFDVALRELITNSPSNQQPKKPVIYRVSRTVVRLNEDFDFLFSDDVENFTSFKHGEVFGHDGDKPLMAKNEGEAVVFPNRHVAVGQRAALMVCEVKTRYEDDQLVYD
ncbi:succinylglutamate desuccinylase [Vibrio marisflavi]|uniref:Succinylglutamate desuccinylase n=1 Tax=Vibrio marisflavi CECT 7928 TaxID=634439 RepID=A0ABM9A4P4_9VIBR|nr:succinylglutamate desuccinylase [Vibrio marisflavi]CAH0539688.1 Succinylglutamate desuccinylase [Vibrio marisflavi CECT 7928]